MLRSIKYNLQKPHVPKDVSSRAKFAAKRQPTVETLSLEDDDEMVGDEQLFIGDISADPEAAAPPVGPSTTKKSDGPDLCKMIADERWLDIQELLTKQKDESVDIIDADGTVTRELIIHHACSHSVPEVVLKSLSQEYWKSLYHADKDGRFPIHVAALHGASPDIISFLINSNGATAGIKDALGKTPLHYICENFLDKNKDASSLRTHQQMFWCIGFLIKAAPSSVNVEDKEEMNPIEYAIASGAHVGIIKEMQKASRNCWRARQKREGWRKHAEYAQYLQDQSSPCLMESMPVSSSNSAA